MCRAGVGMFYECKQVKFEVKSSVANTNYSFYFFYPLSHTIISTTASPFLTSGPNILFISSCTNPNSSFRWGQPVTPTGFAKPAISPKARIYLSSTVPNASPRGTAHANARKKTGKNTRAPASKLLDLPTQTRPRREIPP